MALLSVAWSYAISHAFNLPIGPFAVAMIAALTQMLSWLPIYVFGGLGVGDVTAVYLFECFGIGRSISTPAVIGFRIVFYGLHLFLTTFIILFKLKEIYPGSMPEFLKKLKKPHPPDALGPGLNPARTLNAEDD